MAGPIEEKSRGILWCMVLIPGLTMISEPAW